MRADGSGSAHRSVDSALTLNSPTGSRRREDVRDIEMATVDLDASLEGPEDEKPWADGRGAGVPNLKSDQRPSLFARPWQRGLGRGAGGEGFMTPQGKGKGLDGRPSLARSVMASARPRRDRADLLAESFRWMFPRSFERLVPVSNCRARLRGRDLECSFIVHCSATKLCPCVYCCVIVLSRLDFCLQHGSAMELCTDVWQSAASSGHDKQSARYVLL